MRKKTDNLPISFIKPGQLKLISDEDGKINQRRYEILIYKILRSKIINNDIFIKNSLEYKYIDDDLIDQKYFLENYDEIIGSLDLLPYIHLPLSQVIKEKIEQLEKLIKKVNLNILNNSNPYFEVKDKGKWNLNYSKSNNDNPTDSLFETLPKIDLTDLINFIDDKTNIL